MDITESLFVPRFLGSRASVDEADIVVAGFPYDCTASYRSGSRFASREIRAYSQESIEEFSFYFARSLADVSFFDAGDMDIMVGDPAKMIEQVKQTALSILLSGKKLLGIGGEHLITFPLFLAAQEVYGDFTVLQLDAHADLREGYLSDRFSHASVMQLCLDSGLRELIQLGVRSGTQIEYNRREEDERIVPLNTIDALEDALDDHERVYLTVDVDFFDPACFPGTGTPEAGGYSFDHFVRILKILQRKHVELIGADVVEFVPDLDPSKIALAMATKIVRELLLVMA